MPKIIDPKVKQRCIEQMREHVHEYPNPTAAAEVIAKRNGVGQESVRRWLVQDQIDGGQRQGATSEDLAEIRELKAKVRRLEEDNEILRRASIFFAGTRPPQALIVAFIDECRAAGLAVESVCRVLTEEGCQIAARTYRLWKCPDQQVAARTVTDAQVMDLVRDLAWTIDSEGELAGVRRLTPEGLYGRRKMTRLVRRRMPEATPGAVDRVMKGLGLKGVRRAKGVRTTIPGKDGKRAGDLLNRDFTAEAPNRTWVMTSPTSGPGPGSSTRPSSSTCSRRRSSPGTARSPRTSSWS